MRSDAIGVCSVLQEEAATRRGVSSRLASTEDELSLTRRDLESWRGTFECEMSEHLSQIQTEQKAFSDSLREEEAFVEERCRLSEQQLSKVRDDVVSLQALSHQTEMLEELAHRPATIDSEMNCGFRAGESRWKSLDTAAASHAAEIEERFACAARQLLEVREDFAVSLSAQKREILMAEESRSVSLNEVVSQSTRQQFETCLRAHEENLNEGLRQEAAERRNGHKRRRCRKSAVAEESSTQQR